MISPIPGQQHSYVYTQRQIATSGLASGGGNLSADRTIDVPVASQSEAEGATANTKGMTPLRVAQEVTFNLSSFLDTSFSSTQGSVLYRGASAWAALGPGTSGQFLKSQGAGANPIWASVGGGITTIASGSVGTGTTAVIATSIPSTYAYLVLLISSLSSNNVSSFDVQVSTDNGGSYDTTSGNYLGTIVTTTTVAANGRASLLPSSAPTLAANSLSGCVSIYGYQGGPNITTVGQLNNAGTQMSSWVRYTGTSAMNAMRIAASSGNFDSGTFALYGVS